MIPSNYCLFSHETSSQGIVLFDFKPDPKSQLPQINLKKGDTVVIEKKPKGWWVGHKEGALST